MGPVRGNKKKRKVDTEVEEKSVSGCLQKNSAEWWDVLSKKFAGNPSSSQGLNFKSTFKMSIKTFDYICSLVKDHMMAKTHFAFTNGEWMSLNDQVALALQRLGSGESLIFIGTSFGAHHSTVSQVTWQFVEALEANGLHHVQWPSTENEMAVIKSKFEKIRGLPNCCGAVDTTHITMLLTSSDQEADAWLDRQQKHSMIMQAIVDSSLKFRDIVAGWPGKMNDSSVLQNSNFFKLCQKGEKLNGNAICLSSKIKSREYIIGDPGFPLLPWLVTPYQGKRLSEAKAEFNDRLIATHFVAQKALVKLKEVWRMIRGDLWRPAKVKLPRIILVCCILHNIIIEMEEQEEEDDIVEFSSYLQHDPGYKQEFCKSVDKGGSALRSKLSKYFSGR